jgi:spermidine/putrescine ABC transporter ATP-binding subunit
MNTVQSAPIISLRNVTKAFGSVVAVNDVSLEIGRGEFFSLLGPSGCGKTTLLRMLAGFEVPSKGEILIDGQDVSSVPPNLRPTNMVFQSYAIFPHLNVRQNIAYGLRKKGLSEADKTRTVDGMLDLIKMPGYGARAAHQLSGGQRQRVALARALVCQPKVLLLDEPLGALDKKLREEMQIELRQLQRKVGITFVFVTHDQEEALALSDRIAVMFEGKVRQVDSSARLYERPNCRQVAEFIGTTNLIAGQVQELANGIAKVAVAQLGILEAMVGETKPAIGASVLIAIRPEKLRLSTEPPASPSSAILSGRVSAQAYFGDRSLFHVEVPGLSRPIAVSAQNADPTLALAGTEAGATGRKVWLDWPKDTAILLAE